MIISRRTAICAVSCTIALACHNTEAQLYNWTTIAGTANTAGTADGTNNGALFYAPYGVALDRSGNLYVADYLADTIRKLTPVGTNWVVTTIAGTATNSGSADGTNTAALFNGPRGLVVDNSGNIFVCDQGNATIRMLTLAGTNWVSSTIAGSAGNLGSADGTNSAAQFEFPAGITQDQAGNLYVADYTNDTIRELTPSGTNWIVSTIAGSARSAGTNDGLGGVARFHGPYDVILDNGGNLYVPDFFNSTVRKLTPSGTNWIVSTIAGSPENNGDIDASNGTAQFHWPTGAAEDGGGDVYVTDTYNDTVRKLVQIGTNWVVSTIGGTVSDTAPSDGTNSLAHFNHPRGLKVDSYGNIYVADYDHATIQMGMPVNPSFASISLATPNLVINGSNGLAGGTYFLLTSTNVALPLSNWALLSTNVLTATGNFTITATNVVIPNSPQQFYILQLQ